jgi:hypothetical protein
MNEMGVRDRGFMEATWLRRPAAPPNLQIQDGVRPGVDHPPELGSPRRHRDPGRLVPRVRDRHEVDRQVERRRRRRVAGVFAGARREFLVADGNGSSRQASHLRPHLPSLTPFRRLVGRYRCLNLLRLGNEGNSPGQGSAFRPLGQRWSDAGSACWIRRNLHVSCWLASPSVATRSITGKTAPYRIFAER